MTSITLVVFALLRKNYANILNISEKKLYISLKVCSVLILINSFKNTYYKYLQQCIYCCFMNAIVLFTFYVFNTCDLFNVCGTT